jgi:hypothetical protein
MRNPNDVTTTIKQESNNLVIEFGYANAHLAQYDLESVMETYGSAQSVETKNNKIIVTIPLQ